MNIPKWQKIRYGLIGLSCVLFFAPLSFIPGLFGSRDFCGILCMRRFYLYWPGMSVEDLTFQVMVSIGGVILLCVILVVTFLFGRLWCGYVCPVGGFPELVSRMLGERIKIDYRVLPQAPIRYGYLGFYLVTMPVLGISACTLCNFIVLPRIFDALSGGREGIMYLLTSVGLTNLALVFLLGFFAHKGRAYCSFLCPIGAIDGIVNRIGASFGFTRRIRVSMSRCNGCGVCAITCMCGAISIHRDKAVVDQLSCMSCHECVDVCAADAIEYLVIPPAGRTQRSPRCREIEPVWTGVYSKTGINVKRIFLMSLTAVVIAFIFVTQVYAGKRRTDPEGCLTCHAIKGLQYIDNNGLLRDATIDESHYYSSIHGGIPCRDCHAGIERFPHDAKKGGVDCANRCHINEPSSNARYSHKDIVDEFKDSVHGNGATSGFTGRNRLDETVSLLPSCRRCHSNTLYVDDKRIDEFKEVFKDCERECGRCHRGRAWRSQSAGHIIRRLLGARRTKKEEIALCNGCHGDVEMMKEVELEDKKTGKKKRADERFIMAGTSYLLTLHGRLLERNNQYGTSCMDCHAPQDYRHRILRSDNPLSSTHIKNLPHTCGSVCHDYADIPLNTAFLTTDMHPLDLTPLDTKDIFRAMWREPSGWFVSVLILLPVVGFLGLASLVRLFYGVGTKRKKKHPFILGEFFYRKVIRKRKKIDKIVIVMLTVSLITTEAMAGNPYIDIVKNGTVMKEDLEKMEEKIRTYRERRIIDDLPLKPFHKRTPQGMKGKTLCLVCHKTLPHREDESMRAFLNMHTAFISCEVCHLRIKGIVPEKRWFKYGDTELIVSFYGGTPLVVSLDHPFARNIERVWNSMDTQLKAELNIRIHLPVKKDNTRCMDCHRREQKILDLEKLGFTQERIQRFYNNRIARFVERYRKNKRKISLTGLVE